MTTSAFGSKRDRYRGRRESEVVSVSRGASGHEQRPTLPLIPPLQTASAPVFHLSMPVQASVTPTGGSAFRGTVRQAPQAGVRTPATTLPYWGQIQPSLGRQRIGRTQAHIGAAEGQPAKELLNRFAGATGERGLRNDPQAPVQFDKGNSRKRRKASDNSWNPNSDRVSRRSRKGSRFTCKSNNPFGRFVGTKHSTYRLDRNMKPEKQTALLQSLKQKVPGFIDPNDVDWRSEETPLGNPTSGQYWDGRKQHTLYLADESEGATYTERQADNHPVEPMELDGEIPKDDQVHVEKVITRKDVQTLRPRTSQNTAMGGVSANKMAEKKGFEPQRWEWLHLIAHSLGGETSPANLVAGTTECNSQMIPFEDAIKLIIMQTGNSVKLAVSAEMLDQELHIGSRIIYDFVAVNADGKHVGEHHRYQFDCLSRSKPVESMVPFISNSLLIKYQDSSRQPA